MIFRSRTQISIGLFFLLLSFSQIWSKSLYFSSSKKNFLKFFSLRGLGASIADFGSIGPWFEPDRRQYFFFLYPFSLTSYISTSGLLTVTADPILKLATSEGFPQFLKKAKIALKLITIVNFLLPLQTRCHLFIQS